METEKLLVLNAGTSSLKFAVYERNSDLKPLIRGKIERIGEVVAKCWLCNLSSEKETRRNVPAQTHVAALEILLKALGEVLDIEALTAVGHRIVHGGPRFSNACVVSPEVLNELRQIVSFAEEHLPAEISVIEATAARLPRVQQVVCFDTSFHRALPDVARRLPIPRRYEAAGIRRYGFHGLSCRYMIEQVRAMWGDRAARGRIVLAHLGNGASLTAVCEGQSIDTSMGFTPTAGLVMGTRCGDLDPGLLAYLARVESLTPKQLTDLVDRRSGLLGVSETSGDMRDLLKAVATDARAGEAIRLFCYEAKKRIGAYAAAMNGVDILVFSGGIGENCPSVRERICKDMSYLGLEIDDPRNDVNNKIISTTSSKVLVMVVKADEESVIAQETHQALSAIVEPSPPVQIAP